MRSGIAEIRVVTDFERIAPSPAKILRFQGYRDLRQVADEVRDAAEEAARTVPPLLEPAASFRIVSLEAAAATESVVLERTVRFRSADLARAFGQASHGAAFVATIGPALEERVDALYRAGEYLAWYLLDSAGTLALHLTVAQLRARVALVAREMGCRLVGKIGPGHGDWPLTDQARLFSFFEAAPLPVALVEADLMLPKKSMSGLFGLAPLDATRASAG